MNLIQLIITLLMHPETTELPFYHEYFVRYAMKPPKELPWPCDLIQSTALCYKNDTLWS